MASQMKQPGRNLALMVFINVRLHFPAQIMLPATPTGKRLGVWQKPLTAG
jgi:hypothetical protein